MSGLQIHTLSKSISNLCDNNSNLSVLKSNYFTLFLLTAMEEHAAGYGKTPAATKLLLVAHLLNLIRNKLPLDFSVTMALLSPSLPRNPHKNSIKKYSSPVIKIILLLHIAEVSVPHLPLQEESCTC